MNLNELINLIAAGESLTLELKKSTAKIDRACRSLCALANGEGGHVVFGITLAGKVVGQTVIPEMRCQPYESKPWIPWLAKVFHRRGFIETWGRGALKIASLMQATGLPVPTWQERSESVVMTLLRPKVSGTVTGELKQQVVRLIHANPRIQRKTIAANTNGAARTVDRCIAQCIAENKIERRGSKKAGGTITPEFPPLVEYAQFATVHHEHFSYLPLTAVQPIFAANGLTVYDVRKLPIDRGRMRVLTRRTDGSAGHAHEPVHERVGQILACGGAAGVRRAGLNIDFQPQALRIKRDLLCFC